MTLDAAQIGRLTRLIEANRPGWDAQGILTHVEKLATDPRPWPELEVQAIARSADFAQATPACLLRPLTTPPPLISPPKVVTVWCETHLVDARLRPDGERACCWADTAEPVPVARRSRPAPPGIREQVAGSLRVKETETK